MVKSPKRLLKELNKLTGGMALFRKKYIKLPIISAAREINKSEWEEFTVSLDVLTDRAPIGSIYLARGSRDLNIISTLRRLLEKTPYPLQTYKVHTEEVGIHSRELYGAYVSDEYLMKEPTGVIFSYLIGNVIRVLVRSASGLVNDENLAQWGLFLSELYPICLSYLDFLVELNLLCGQSPTFDAKGSLKYISSLRISIIDLMRDTRNNLMKTATNAERKIIKKQFKRYIL